VLRALSHATQPMTAAEIGRKLGRRNPQTVMPRALYDLQNDPGEQKNVLADHPDEANRLQAMIEEAREDLGDSRRDMVGKNVRPIGKIKR